MGAHRLSPLERFLLKVQVSEDGCWQWLASRDIDGYGKFGYNGDSRPAHAVAYALAYGKIPEGMCVLHHCDNRSCVRPSHLFLGTRQDNTRDMVEKGRSARGNRNGSGPRKTDDEIVAMRAQYDSGKCSFAHVAKVYNVSRITAMRICKRQRYRHVPELVN